MNTLPILDIESLDMEARGIRLYDAQPVVYHCPEDWTKVRDMIRSLGRADAEIIDFALQWKCVRGITFQPVQDAGRNEGFDAGRDRIVLSDIRRRIAALQPKSFPVGYGAFAALASAIRRAPRRSRPCIPCRQR